MTTAPSILNLLLAVTFFLACSLAFIDWWVRHGR